MEGLEGVVRNLRDLERRMLRQTEEAAGEIAALLADYAKTHHDWRPVTGATDVSTVGSWERVREDLIRIVLSAGREYDVMLELARGGKWAWLRSAMEANLSDIQRILARSWSL